MNETTLLTEVRWRAEQLWGAPAIARFAGVDITTIYRWYRLPGCPITKVGGRYFVTRSTMMTWLTSKAA